ncbi:Uncharacterised protein [Vibrio cholerae]|nr:Uncharacterised protein [Vibrio cholerae]CSA76153.1 Uncharacterised protein [Vibrio cholerae]CSC32680.1 Uncharacterised protein [Vibrio cholerae]CSD35873.1 Uncharacterised protein [Vibrio cholerae]
MVGREGITILHMPFNAHLAAELFKHFIRPQLAAKHPRFTSDDGRGADAIGWNQACGNVGRRVKCAA